MNKKLREKIVEDMKQRLSAKRFKHVLAVADAAVKLAHHYGQNEEKAELAGLLHDAAKEESLKCMQDSARILYGSTLDDEVMQRPELLHGYAAAAYASLTYNVFDNDVLRAIAYHTTGHIEMSPLEKIIFLADYIEVNRDFPEAEELKKTAFIDLDRAVLMGYDTTLAYLIKQEKAIYTGTVANRNALLAEVKKADGV